MAHTVRSSGFLVTRNREYALCLFLTAGQLVLGHFCPVKKRGMRFVLFWKKTLCHLCYPSNAVFALFFAGTCHTQILGYYSLHSISNPSIRFSNRLQTQNLAVLRLVWRLFEFHAVPSVPVASHCAAIFLKHQVSDR